MFKIETGDGDGYTIDVTKVEAWGTDRPVPRKFFVIINGKEYNTDQDIEGHLQRFIECLKQDKSIGGFK